MRKYKYMVIGILVMALFLIAGRTPARAQEVIVSGTFAIYTDAEHTRSEEVSLSGLDAIGYADDQVVVAFDGTRAADPEMYRVIGAERIGYINRNALETLSPAFSDLNIPEVTDWQTQRNGSNGEMAKEVQDLLIGLGYLEGTSDGDYGPNTQNAVDAFLISTGMEAGGDVDAAVYLLLVRASDPAYQNEDVLYAEDLAPISAEEKFAAIYQTVSDASILDDFTDTSWKFFYDVFEGKGMIRKALGAAPYVNNARAVDRIEISLQAVIYLERSEAEEIVMTPGLLAHAEGAYRPYIQSAILNLDGVSAELPAFILSGESVSGDLAEEAVVTFTDEALDMIRRGGGSLLIRLNGVNHTYDMDLSDVVTELQELRVEETAPSPAIVDR